MFGLGGGGGSVHDADDGILTPTPPPATPAVVAARALARCPGAITRPKTSTADSSNSSAELEVNDAAGTAIAIGRYGPEEIKPLAPTPAPSLLPLEAPLLLEVIVEDGLAIEEGVAGRKASLLRGESGRRASSAAMRAELEARCRRE